MQFRPSVYLDTSVINFLYADDAPEKKEITVDLFNNFVRTSIYQVFISDVVIVEINNTREKDKKQNLLSVIEEYNLVFISLTPAELIFYGT